MRQQIVALASEKPQDHGIEMTNWTHEMLAKIAIAQGVVRKISSRHVGNILKKRIATSQVRILVVP